ncbi:hypothetical protein JCM10212_004577 [Sporobolomyces blumeae]
MLSVLSLLALPAIASAHMSPWLPSMYGVGPNFAYDAGNPVDPIGPGWTTQDDWWFRGPNYRALKPQSNVATALPAGGSLTLEIACHVAWTSYGWSTTEPGSALDACPGDNAGPYHAGDPLSTEIDENLISGCALAIADVEDIEDVTMDNLVVFSVNHNCIKQKMTTFEIPAKMPKCTGSNCICSWHWLANNGTANYYQTGFNCTVTGSPADATAIAPPSDPVFCKNNPSSCTTGAKRPIYAYNYPSNVPWIGNNDRAGYHASWSFPNDGAQNDIFLAAGQVANASKSDQPTGANPYFGTPVGAGGAPDLALNVATVDSSSASFGQGPWHAVDGWAGGYNEQGTGNENQEWASNGQGVGAWLNLAWSSPVTFNQLVVFDRPNLDDQVTAANVSFSDGSFVAIGALENSGLATYFNFSTPVTTSSLRFTVTGVSSSTSNVGLSEIEIYSVPASDFSQTTTVQGVPVVVSSSAAISASASSSAVSASSTSANSTASVPASTSAVTTSTASNSTAPASASASNLGVVLSVVRGVVLGCIVCLDGLDSIDDLDSIDGILQLRLVDRFGSGRDVGIECDRLCYELRRVLDRILVLCLDFRLTAPTRQRWGQHHDDSVRLAYFLVGFFVLGGLDYDNFVHCHIDDNNFDLNEGFDDNDDDDDDHHHHNAIQGCDDDYDVEDDDLGFRRVVLDSAIDGIIGGSGGTSEWASYGQGAGAWFTLTWPSAVTFNQIVLWDRPNRYDQVLAGNVTFADGTGVSFGQVPNNGATGLYVNLASSITTTSLKIYISQVSSTTVNVGFSEVQVFLADASKFASGTTLIATKPAVVSSVKATSTTTTKTLAAQTVVANPKSTVVTTTATTTTTSRAASSQATGTTTQAPASTTTSPGLVAWNQVSALARTILAVPAGKRAYYEPSSNGTRHVRDFRMVSE